MSQFPIAAVVKILIHDPTLSRGSNEFAKLLGIDAVARDKIRSNHTLGTNTSTNYYTELLENWAGRLGKDATVGKLRGILEQGEFQSAADLLEHLDVPDPSKNSVDQPTQADMSDATTSTPTPASTDMSVFLLSNQAVRRDVTKTLQNQVPLLTAWERFCDDLDIPKGELITCKQQYSNGCMTNYALLNHILSLWGSREGSEGNVANLIKVLRSGEFLDSENKIKCKFASWPISQQ
ncbi:uncharacterized protein LOC110849816 [Folsomia candida]|uniref:Death domain-containing protein n=1 Tax=Folsomia candida TaxID=158441 RepID=A0A226ECP6_FOLCA|nr:uncharacterized protein LOC110849816 [Folsomia candida]OXA54978.1 hypothetical protein Fcan01_10319 [Folsomia candida]